MIYIFAPVDINIVNLVFKYIKKIMKDIVYIVMLMIKII